MSQEESSENPYGSPVCEAPSDGELLRRFTTDKDQAAFETLVCRHGSLVWNVCRRVLRGRQDAEDAFQATFLILLRQADSIRKRKSLRSWLFGVARRVAMKALRSEYRRLQFLHRLVWDREAHEPSSPVGEGIRKVVDEELAGLPDIQRMVIEKCVFARESYRQVSTELRIPESTVASHLRRGRKALRARLVARGIGAGGLALLTTLGTEAPSECLCRATVQNAAALLAGEQAALPVRVVSLMKGVVLNMSITAKCILGLALLLGGGASTWWAARGTADEAVDSGIELAEDAPTVEAALVLEVDVPGEPKGSPSIEFVAEPSVVQAVLELDVPGVHTGTPTIEFVAEPSLR